MPERSPSLRDEIKAELEKWEARLSDDLAALRQAEKVACHLRGQAEASSRAVQALRNTLEDYEAYVRA